MKPTTVQDMLTRIDDRYILESHPNLVREENIRSGVILPPEESAWKRFWQSGWAAAVLSVIVSVAVLIAVVAAGRMGADNPLPPAGGEIDTLYPSRIPAFQGKVNYYIDTRGGAYVDEKTTEILAEVKAIRPGDTIRYPKLWALESLTDPDMEIIYYEETGGCPREESGEGHAHIFLDPLTEGLYRLHLITEQDGERRSTASDELAVGAYYSDLLEALKKSETLPAESESEETVPEAWPDKLPDPVTVTYRKDDALLSEFFSGNRGDVSWAEHLERYPQAGDAVYVATPEGFYEATGAQLFCDKAAAGTYVRMNGHNYALHGMVTYATTCDYDLDGTTDIVYTFSLGSGVSITGTALFNVRTGETHLLATAGLGDNTFVMPNCIALMIDGTIHLYEASYAPGQTAGSDGGYSEVWTPIRLACYYRLNQGELPTLVMQDGTEYPTGGYPVTETETDETETEPPEETVDTIVTTEVPFYINGIRVDCGEMPAVLVKHPPATVGPNHYPDPRSGRVPLFPALRTIGAQVEKVSDETYLIHYKGVTAKIYRDDLRPNKPRYIIEASHHEYLDYLGSILGSTTVFVQHTGDDFILDTGSLRAVLSFIEADEYTSYWSMTEDFNGQEIRMTTNVNAPAYTISVPAEIPAGTTTVTVTHYATHPGETVDLGDFRLRNNTQDIWLDLPAMEDVSPAAPDDPAAYLVFERICHIPAEYLIAGNEYRLVSYVNGKEVTSTIFRVTE